MCNTHVLATVCSVTGLLPGSNCPKTSMVRIALPAEEEGETDDSKYAMPTRHCSGHTSVTVDPSYLDQMRLMTVPAPVELVLFPALDQAAPAPGLPRACRTDQDATKFIPKKL
jgi:hypothetical protein